MCVYDLLDATAVILDELIIYISVRCCMRLDCITCLFKNYAGPTVLGTDRRGRTDAWNQLCFYAWHDPCRVKLYPLNYAAIDIFELKAFQLFLRMITCNNKSLTTVLCFVLKATCELRMVKRGRYQSLSRRLQTSMHQVRRNIRLV